jgi:very-short-patch-repair endonuclease
MRAAEVLRHLGGLGTRAALLRVVPRVDVDRALSAGAIVATARGRYALAEVQDARLVAHRHSGVLGLTSAALHHGWEVKEVPSVPHVILPRKRNRPRTDDLIPHFRDLQLDEVTADGIATSVDVTLDQCLRCLPYDEALAIADSALRDGVPPNTLRRVAAGARGPGTVQLKRVVALADGDAANPFESVLRAIAHQVPGLHVVPQVLIRTKRGWFRPDLVDRDLGMALEADSFGWHGSRVALARDANRYNALVVDGWVVLRFAWEDVMHRPGEVLAVLVDAVQLVAEQAHLRARLLRPA